MIENTEGSHNRRLFLRCSNNAERITSVAFIWQYVRLLHEINLLNPLFLGLKLQVVNAAFAYCYHHTSGEI